MPPRPAEISRRLKAARWLAGGLDEKGKPKELKVAELAQRAPLPENKITANRLAEIEQMRITPPPMELEKIAEALGVDPEWFTLEELVAQAVRPSYRQITEILAGLEHVAAVGGQAGGPSVAETPSGPAGKDRPSEGAGGGGA